MTARLLIVVFDGLRPDMVQGHMPGLQDFGQGALRFTGARSVFPSLTRVATTAISSGCWPRRHGIVGNAFHQPDLIAGRALDTSDFGHLARARAAWGRLVGPRTLGEALAAAGLRLAVFHGGSAGAACLINPEVVSNPGHATFSIHGAEATLTPAAVAAAEAALGPRPTGGPPKSAQVGYVAGLAAQALADPSGPEVVLVWFPEPDTSFHYLEIGSAATAQAMTAADAAFARLVGAAPPGTAICVLSDHGQIATTGLFDIEAEMRAAGLPAARRPGPDDRVALTLGRMGECRLLRPDPALLADTAAWLMQRPEIGMVLARDDLAASLPGTLPLSAVHLDHPRAPDLVHVMIDDPGPDRHGLAGRGLMTGGGVPVGGGMHGGLAPGELATVFWLALPDGPAGADDRPCALPDIAPTLLALLGLPPMPGAEGRALPLDMRAPDAPTEEVEITATGPAGFAQGLVLRRGDGRVVIEHGRRR